MEKALPHSDEMEQAVLASVLYNRDAMLPAAAILPDPEDFYTQSLAHVWRAMLDLHDNRTPPDLQLVAERLRQMGRLDPIGGLPFLISLTERAVSYHVTFYAEQVAAAAARRRAILASAEISKLAYDEALPIGELYPAAQQSLDTALVRLQSRPSATLAEVMGDKFEAMKGGRQSQSVCTGFRDIDDPQTGLGGLHRSDLILLAARPSIGKTALALSIAYNIAWDQRRVLAFSLEMSRDQLGERLLAIRTGIDTHRLRMNIFRGDEESTVVQAMGDLAAMPMVIEDQAALTLADIRARTLREITANGPLDLILVDYLQLMSSSGKRENRVQEVGDLSRGLKLLARELHTPILALSQLSRAVEGRTTHVPMLSDLRDSGNLEQDADVVLFIYREEVYDADTEKKGTADIHIAKNRNGPLGVIPLRFDGSTTRFSDLTYRTPEGY